ncbi:MAG TPA: hypothetical protein VEQ59_17990, partial [Polyangiaceae bacterium]|nr:hypothetical protein [Polyangiaceae bacterium]
AGTCPASAAIERDVSQRLGRDPFTAAGERGIEVVLSRDESTWKALLYLRIDAAAPDAVRLLESADASCAELGKSVALAVALAIAPDLPPLEEPKKPEPLPPPLAPPPSPPAPARLSLHGAASLRLLFSPSLLPQRALGTSLTVSMHDDLLGANFGGLFYPQTKLRAADAQLGFGLSAAFASACLWPRTRDPELWSCVGARVGALHSTVYELRPAHPGDHMWWAASTELGLRKRALGPVFVEVGAAALFPFVRQRFQVESASPSGSGSLAATTTVYEQAPAAVEGFVGLGVHLD